MAAAARLSVVEDLVAGDLAVVAVAVAGSVGLVVADSVAEVQGEAGEGQGLVTPAPRVDPSPGS